MPKSDAKTAQTFNPRSDALVLTYEGTDETEDAPAYQPVLGGIPARDLTEADIARLVYMAAINEYDGEPGGPPMPDPEKPSQAKCRALVELLLERKVDGRAVYGRATAKDKKDHQDEEAAAATPIEPTPTESAQPEA